MVDILVLGATGFTGKLIVEYLHKHPQRSTFTFGIGVRSRDKGEALKRKLGLDDSVELVFLDVTDYHAVVDAVKQAKVVINTVGPYWTWGVPVVKACVLHGKRYVDLTGEPPFMRKIIDKFDHLATKTGAIIVPASGLDCMPADIAVFLSNRTLKSALGPDTQLGRSETFYNLPLHISGGTISTLITGLEKVPREKRRAGMREYSLSPVIGARAPRVGLVAPVPFSHGQYGGLWVMKNVNRSVVQRTFGLAELGVRTAAVQGAHGDTDKRRALTYGPHFTYDEHYVRPGMGRLGATVFSLWVGVFFGSLLLAPIRWVYKTFFAMAPGQGPSEHQMRTGYLEATNYTASAPADGKPETWAKTVITGQGDAGYSLTAVMISEAALGLLLNDDELPITARPGGILTPATALGDVLIKRMTASGRMQFSSEIVKADAESRKTR